MENEWEYDSAFDGEKNQELKRRGLDAELEFADIESLNRGTEDGRLDLSAISVGAYPTFADRYRLLRCGASFAPPPASSAKLARGQ